MAPTITTSTIHYCYRTSKFYNKQNRTCQSSDVVRTLLLQQFLPWTIPLPIKQEQRKHTTHNRPSLEINSIRLFSIICLVKIAKSMRTGRLAHPLRQFPNEHVARFLARDGSAEDLPVRLGVAMPCIKGNAIVFADGRVEG